MTETAGSLHSETVESSTSENSANNFEGLKGLSQSPMPASQGMKALNSLRQNFANRLAGLFRDYTVRILQDLPQQASRVIFWDGKELYFQPLSDSNGNIIANSNNLDGLVDILKQSEEIIGLFERRTGIGFEPVETSKEVKPGTIWLEISLKNKPDEEHLVRKARFGFSPKSQTLENLAQPNGIPALFNVPVLAKVTLSGPSLNLMDVAELAKGDLVFLASGKCNAALTYDDDFSGRFNSAEGILSLDTGKFQPNFADAAADQGEMSMTENNAAQDIQGAERQFSVPVKITIPEISVSAAKLASLKEGTTLEIGPLSVGLQVKLNVGGRSIGSGEIVKLGDNFAVLVDNIIGANEIPPKQDGFSQTDDLQEQEQHEQVEQS